MLANPISIAGFIFASHLFFKDRIPYEEELLVDFFGDAYIEYALKTPIWLPGIESYIKEEDGKGDKKKQKWTLQERMTKLFITFYLIII